MAAAAYVCFSGLFFGQYLAVDALFLSDVCTTSPGHASLACRPLRRPSGAPYASGKTETGSAAIPARTPRCAPCSSSARQHRHASRISHLSRMDPFVGSSGISEHFRFRGGGNTMGKSPSYHLAGLTCGPTFGPFVPLSYLGPRWRLSPKGTMSCETARARFLHARRAQFD